MLPLFLYGFLTSKFRISFGIIVDNSGYFPISPLLYPFEWYFPDVFLCSRVLDSISSIKIVHKYVI